MPYNAELADRLRAQLGPQRRVTEQEMFGGISFMIAGNMCCGVLGDDLVVRIDPTLHHDALTRPGVSEFEMGGRTSKGMVRVGPPGTRDDLDLALWVRLGVTHASSLPPRAAKKAARARKRDTTAPPRKKAPVKKKSPPAKKKAPPGKKAAGARRGPAKPRTTRTDKVKKAAKAARATKAKKITKARKAAKPTKVGKARKAPRARK